jgi:hypothetical protein
MGFIDDLFGGGDEPETTTNTPPNVSTEPAATSSATKKNIARAMLIATSPQGVLGSPSVGRQKILGN